ncbi:hypothetical protein CSW62_05035 [Caulobacter sp. FWC2]|nr:hypothetical protein CSW62_05035 [Caulobacter sp. FWC2]
MFTYGEMSGAGITRKPKLKLRTISADGHVSNRYTLVEAINPPPVINTQPVVTPQLDSVAVTIQRPVDGDLAGYLMAVSPVEVFDPEAHIIFDSTSNAFTVPINSAVQTYWARFAAYDEFGKDSLVWTTPQAISTYNGDWTDVFDQLDQIRHEVDELQEVVDTKIGELEDLFGDRVEEALETIAETEERVNDMLADGLALGEQFEQLGETLLQNQMQGVKETSERIDATYLADKPLGSVVVNEITRTDDLVETTNLIAVKAADGQSVILRTDKVFVQDGVSVAQKLEFMEAKTDQAKADALDQITLTASELRAEADSKFTLQTEFGDFQSSVGQQFQSVSDANSALAQFDSLLGVKNGTNSAIILNTDKVLVTPSQSLADKFTSMSAETAQAKADALQQITIATNATKAEANSKFVLLTNFADYQTQVQQNFTSNSSSNAALAQFDQILGVKNAQGTAITLNTDKVLVAPSQSLSQKFTSLSAETAQAKADAISQITVATDAVKSEANSKFALVTDFNGFKTTTTQNFTNVSNQTSALASFDQAVGVMRGDGQSITLNTSKVYIDATTTWSQRDSLIESRFAGNSSSYLLSTANTAASNASSAVTTLQQMGVTLNNGSAWILDSSKVNIGGGESLATRLTNLQSSVNGKPSVAYVDSQVTAYTGPNSSIASQINSVQTTANGANSNATIALNATNGNSATIGILAAVNGRVTGLKMNGATGTVMFEANNFGIIQTGGGTSVLPFNVSGGTVYMDNVVARNIGAGTITADKIVGGAITNQLIFETGTWTSFDAFSEMNHLTFNYYCEGGAVSLSVYCEIGTTTNAAAGGVYRIYCDGVALNSGADYCTPLWGQKGVTIPSKSNPGVGVHTYRIAYQATPGSGAVRANRTYVLLTELKK